MTQKQAIEKMWGDFPRSLIIPCFVSVAVTTAVTSGMIVLP